MAEQLTSVRFDVETLNSLRALADVHDSNIATEVRAAVSRYIREVTSDPAFREKAAKSVEDRKERVERLLGANSSVGRHS